MISIKQTLLTTAFVLALPFAAQAATLDFTIAPGQTNGTLPGDYGDNLAAAPNVTVSYQGLDPKIWTTGYSDLTNVLYDETDGSPGFGFTLTAAAGFEVALDSFDLGNFGIALTLPAITVSADGAPYSSELAFSLGSTSQLSQTVTPTDAGGNSVFASAISVFINLEGLGRNSDNVGIDNVQFSQRAVSPQISPIPLPTGLPLLLLGLGAFGLLRRKA